MEGDGTTERLGPLVPLGAERPARPQPGDSVATFYEDR